MDCNCGYNFDIVYIIQIYFFHCIAMSLYHFTESTNQTFDIMHTPKAPLNHD